MSPSNTAAAALALVTVAAAQEPDFSQGVRTTDPLTAAEQQARFHLPPGFAIELVVSEPEIAKPMNLAFDARGRLWVTSSVEYPYAAAEGTVGRDHLHVLDDTDGDGRADKVTEFADGLNIPIGVYPFNGGRSAVVWSIPNIWRFDDTDGDGRADVRTILYGPVGDAVDTHGMQNGFTRGFDGWLYICHGFRNSSTVRGGDGSEVNLESGNTYRVRLDGSRAERFTSGQVNPFGFCFDPDGNAYTADCHSSPIYQLVRGGYYPSFGKPHDGLGFAPTLMQHTHGSTALCGVAYYRAGSNWPEEFRDCLFVGNVMTSRVHRDRVLHTGSSPRAEELEDFLTCDDPWFRPVDLQFGPDGALYIADFYNRIIGHYEVPLEHPGRDRERGRIWRVRYTGAGGDPEPGPRDLAAAEVGGLVEALGSAGLTRRLHATNELVDRFGEAAVPALREAVATGGGSEGNPLGRAHALWALERTAGLEPEELARATADPDPVVRIHAMRILGERGEGGVQTYRMLEAALGDPDAGVRRQAAAALGSVRWSGVDPVGVLAETLAETPPADTYLAYTLKIALRDQLRAAPAAFDSLPLTGAGAPVFVAVAAAVPAPEAARYLLRSIAEPTAEGLAVLGEPAAVRHMARYLPEGDLPLLGRLAGERAGTSPVAELGGFQAIEAGLDQRGHPPEPVLRTWAESLAGRLLAARGGEWRTLPHPGAVGRSGEVSWVLQERAVMGEPHPRTVVSSLGPGGESLTGVLRSPEFPAPGSFEFFLCGHDGFPDRPAKGANFIRICAAADGRELHRAPAPRTDIAQRVSFDLSAHRGEPVYVDLVDGDSGEAYAWIAASFGSGSPEMPVRNPGNADAASRGAVALVRRYQLRGHTGALLAIGRDPLVGETLRVEALELLARSGEPEVRAVILDVANDALSSPGIRGRAAVAALATGAAPGEVLGVLPVVQARLQVELAAAMAGSAEGANVLLDAVEAGAVSAFVLRDKEVAAELARTAVPGWEGRSAAMTGGLPPVDPHLAERIVERLQSIIGAPGNPAEGSKVFAQHCVVCHQIAGVGNVVGPQLDGIGNRGIERLVEDVLDPNRNVDHAFRLTTVTLRDGTRKSGLFRREDGATLVFADVAGQEFSVLSSDVASRENHELSLMPPVYADSLRDREFADLIAYLLTVR